MSASAIFGLSGARLTPEERGFFTRTDPYGYILFARNCETPEQIRALTDSLREVAGRDVPILIDQEGGRVARLKPPLFRPCPAAGTLAALPQAEEAIYTNARLIAHELRALGINVDCAPVADVPVPDAHGIIGDRAYGATPETVARLGAAMARGLSDGGVAPVLKHIPGHGRAKVDSHESLPVVETPLAELERSDFPPFRALNKLPYAMTAHVVFTALDAENLATHSPIVIRYIRENLGFNGVLMTDDLSMKAMQGSFKDRARAALEAGCDLALHCNGDLGEMQQVAEGLSPCAFAPVPVPPVEEYDAASAERQLQAWMAA